MIAGVILQSVLTAIAAHVSTDQHVGHQIVQIDRFRPVVQEIDPAVAIDNIVRNLVPHGRMSSVHHVDGPAIHNVSVDVSKNITVDNVVIVWRIIAAGTEGNAATFGVCNQVVGDAVVAATVP